mmetsp:Transcript_11468/g.26687  ORF Transcript_11468/g.26687 Transcript_11468/m.26687 type:complete len:220 (+) Transcript_11468:248-907(+)
MCSIVGPIILVPKCDRGVLRDLASGGARNTSPSARHVATCPCVLRPSHTTASKIGRCSCLGHIIAPSHLGSLRSTTSNYNAVGRGSDAPKIDHRPGRRLHHGAAMEGLGGRSDDASDAWDSSAGAAILETQQQCLLGGLLRVIACHWLLGGWSSSVQGLRMGVAGRHQPTVFHHRWHSHSFAVLCRVCLRDACAIWFSDVRDMVCRPIIHSTQNCGVFV